MVAIKCSTVQLQVMVAVVLVVRVWLAGVVVTVDVVRTGVAAAA